VIWTTPGSGLGPVVGDFQAADNMLGKLVAARLWCRTPCQGLGPSGPTRPAIQLPQNRSGVWQPEEAG